MYMFTRPSVERRRAVPLSPPVRVACRSVQVPQSNSNTTALLELDLVPGSCAVFGVRWFGFVHTSERLPFLPPICRHRDGIVGMMNTCGFPHLRFTAGTSSSHQLSSSTHLTVYGRQRGA